MMDEIRDNMMEKRYEEHAYVLDFLPHGRPGIRPSGRAGYRAGALVQLMGEEFFTLLEALVQEGVVLKPHDRVYVGKEAREEITYIIGRIGYDELTAAAKMELPAVISRTVLNREQWFINFFNNARAVTPRMHALELIPGIGKKYMWQVINEREKKPFESFDDLQKRTELPNPVKLITKRVLEELAGDSKYRLFTRAQ
jgi:putative nucleotide binding protein